MVSAKIKWFVQCIMLISIVILTTIAVYAWSPNLASAPYTGNFSKASIPNGIETKANDIKWNSSGRASMIYEWYQGIRHALDQTADCSSNSPEGDKLFVSYVIWNIPDSQAFTYNDCDDSQGRPNVNEETELKIYNPPAIVAEQPYRFYVGWGKNTSSAISGEVNVSFEYDGCFYPWCHDWLDKVTYSIPGSGLSSLEKHPAISSEGSQGEENCSPVVLLERMNPTEPYALRVIRTCTNQVRGYVYVDFDDPPTLASYRQYNQELATRLIAQNTGEEVQIAVTFKRPLSVLDVQRIIEQSSLIPYSLIAVGRYPNNDVVMLSKWQYGVENAIDEMELQDILHSNNAHLEGIISVYGHVTATDQGLGTFLNNSEVFLADVVSEEIESLVKEELGLGEIDSLEISVPSPLWQLLQ